MVRDKYQAMDKDTLLTHSYQDYTDLSGEGDAYTTRKVRHLNIPVNVSFVLTLRERSTVR